MKKCFKHFFLLIDITIFALCALPLVSTYCSGEESCTLVVRGYNLMEFSSWGIVSLLAPLLVPAILFGRQSKPTQETELLLLLVADLVCYVHSFNVACSWLREVGSFALSVHPGMVMYPLGIVSLLLLVVFFEFLVMNVQQEDISSGQQRI